MIIFVYLFVQSKDIILPVCENENLNLMNENESVIVWTEVSSPIM